MNEPATTIDGMLNKRVALEQPAQGYRVAVDTVLLAASVPALPGDRVLDMGCGAGGAILCVAARVEAVRGVGIDIQPDLLDMYRRNIARNEFALGLSALEGDATSLPPELAGLFDHAMMNPPYHEESRHDASPNRSKQTANTEKTGDLGLWIASAAAALKPSGTLTIIHRADRQDEILSHLRPIFGEAMILPLLPKAWVDAKRIIIRARKGAVFPAQICRPITLHNVEGGYTEEAEAILRHAQPLAFQSP
jgi:tRNA1(Val) A37 N6-methylase TrmN6